MAVYPLPDGGTPEVYLPAGRGNADFGMWQFTPPPPCRTGERRAVYPCLTGNAGRFTPCRTGERRAVYPCRTGERRMQCGGFSPAGRGNAGRFTPCRTGHADLECGGLPLCRTGARRFGMWRFTSLPDGGTPIWIVAVYASYGNSQPPLPTSSQNKCDRILWMQCARQGA